MATDGRGSYRFKCPFSHVLILSSVFHTFLKIKTSNKNTRLRMNPSTRYASLKKSTYFYAAGLKVIFCLFFTLSIIFYIYSFQISLAVSGDTVL
jgi:hypothetical protein